MFRLSILQPRSSSTLIGFALIMILFAAPSAQAQYDSIPIQTYSYAQFSSSDTASIDLYGVEEKMFAILIFLPEDDPVNLPPAAKGPDGILRLYFKRERLATVIDQLRNESPLVLRFWTGAGGNNTHIGTMDLEAVGEAE